MANGRPFRRMHATVAHRTLPLGSVVRVTNPANGASVTAEVTDRGPYHGNRIIDLSEGTARRLGLHQRGVGPVLVERLR
jgi:rare lipoprotein A